MDISHIRDTRTGKFAKTPKVLCACVGVCVCEREHVAVLGIL